MCIWKCLSKRLPIFFILICLNGTSSANFELSKAACSHTAIVATFLPILRDAFIAAHAKLGNLLLTQTLRHAEKPGVRALVIKMTNEQLGKVPAVVRDSHIQYQAIRYRASPALRWVSIGCGSLACVLGVVGAAGPALGPEIGSVARIFAGVGAVLAVAGTYGARWFDNSFMTMRKPTFWKDYLSEIGRQSAQVEGSDATILIFVTEPTVALEHLKSAGFTPDAKVLRPGDFQGPGNIGE